ncbi:putative Chromosome-associated kinesin KIF4B [Blattamonas nauphoetae]|uniref:Kinesin-like protein n=1 Tax=Blattamonas nauphoetae TaxID=2049346 RepID=A0ABQ9YBT1_9EUKA|nr:putative Chromosome-associated kinesin KIF4B [Blattamonas nauphoetae]
MEINDAKIRTVIRIRPFLPSEDVERCLNVLKDSTSGGKATHLQVFDRVTFQTNTSRFDGCYDEDNTQMDLFSAEIQPSLSHCFNGINFTVFAYGMTGSGKTFTMQGPPNNPGIIPLLVQDLFRQAKTHGLGSKKVTIELGFVEIYTEKIRDLLNPASIDLQLREDIDKTIFVAGLTWKPLNTSSDFTKEYAQGCQNRTVAATRLNAESSRSHAVVMLRVKKTDGNKLLTSKVNLIDLAGSEDNRKTGNTGMRMTESSAINRSLMTLGRVIQAINTNDTRPPYRESKLTRLLQDSLSGGGQSVVIGCLSPSPKFLSDSCKTIEFTRSTGKINTKMVMHAEEIAFWLCPSQTTMTVQDVEGKMVEMKKIQPQRGRTAAAASQNTVRSSKETGMSTEKLIQSLRSIPRLKEVLDILVKEQLESQKGRVEQLEETIQLLTQAVFGSESGGDSSHPAAKKIDRQPRKSTDSIQSNHSLVVPGTKKSEKEKRKEEQDKKFAALQHQLTQIPSKHARRPASAGTAHPQNKDATARPNQPLPNTAAKTSRQPQSPFAKRVQQLTSLSAQNPKHPRLNAAPSQPNRDDVKRTVRFAVDSSASQFPQPPSGESSAAQAMTPTTKLRRVFDLIAESRKAERDQKPAEAIELLQRALQMCPQDKKIRERIDKLQEQHPDIIVKQKRGVPTTNPLLSGKENRPNATQFAFNVLNSPSPIRRVGKGMASGKRAPASGAYDDSLATPFFGRQAEESEWVNEEESASEEKKPKERRKKARKIEREEDETQSAFEQRVVHLLNTGDVKQLMQLGGVGKKKAELILFHRENGRVFSAIDDLRLVLVTEDKLAQLKGLRTTNINEEPSLFAIDD